MYLAAADSHGNMISFIQSNYMGFGSGHCGPRHRHCPENRGAGFSLQEGDANYLRPGKRSYHTIIPGFLTKDGKPGWPFGVMGGFMQPQGHLQVVMNTVDFKLNPQAALGRTAGCGLKAMWWSWKIPCLHTLKQALCGPQSTDSCQECGLWARPNYLAGQPGRPPRRH